MKRKGPASTESVKGLPAEISFNDEFPPGSLKLTSWNIAGLKAALTKGFQRYVDAEKPDILCIQETKINETMSALPKSDYPFQYHSICTVRKGYSGTSVYSKIEPINVSYKIGDDKIDDEGRFIILEFPEYHLVAAYIINAGSNLERLPLKREHYKKLKSFLQELGNSKPVVFCGDINVAHKEIDLARPKQNQKTAGFTPEEREDFDDLLKSLSLVDTYRAQNPDAKDGYTYYSYRFGCRAKNIGWRLDYFLVSESLMDKVVKSVIRNDIYGASDHVPITLVLKQSEQ